MRKYQLFFQDLQYMYQYAILNEQDTRSQYYVGFFFNSEYVC
jgi:hypothetical protein